MFYVYREYTWETEALEKQGKDPYREWIKQDWIYASQVKVVPGIML